MRLSVVVPVRNEEGFISEFLTSLLRQSFPLEQFEVVVVDGLSTDSTVQEARSFQERFHSFKLLSNPDRITSAGINRGIEASTGDVILIVGAHTVLPEDTLEKGMRILEEESEYAGVSGVSVMLLSDVPRIRAIGAALQSFFGVGASHYRTGLKKRRETYNAGYTFFRRWVFEKYGGMDPSFVRSQDFAFFYKLHLAGEKILHCPEIKFLYHYRSDFRSLFKQFFYTAMYKPFIFKQLRTFGRLNNLVPGIFLLFLLVAGVCGIFFKLSLYLFIGAVSVYLVVASVASIAASIRFGVNRFWYVLWAYIVMHFSYGAGFLSGFIRYVVFG